MAIERRDPMMLQIMREALLGKAQIAIPRTVIAQVWRGTGKQANVNRLIGAGAASLSVVIDELTAERAKQIGTVIGATSHPDIVDVHVALVAADHDHAVLTSDDRDIAKVNPDLTIVHV